MKTGFEIGIGAVVAIITIGIALRILGAILISFGKWLEKRSEASMTPEQRASRAAFKMAEYFKNHR